jgi:hypothetical protein
MDPEGNPGKEMLQKVEANVTWITDIGINNDI